MDNSVDTLEIDLGDLLQVIWSKIWIVLAAMLVCMAIAGNITYFFITPQYRATSTIYLIPRENEQTTYSDLQTASKMTSDAAELATSKTVVEPVIEELKLNLTYSQLVHKMTIKNPTDTRLINITVEDPDPQMAADISNALANSLSDSVAEIMKTDRPTQAEMAEAPKNPSSPSMVKNLIIGALLGLFCALAWIIIQYIRDDTIKTAEDVEKYLSLNTLASLPTGYMEEAGTDKKKKKKKK